MKLCQRIAPVFALAAIICSAPAFAEEGPYLGLSAGLSVPFNLTFNAKSGPALNGKVSLGSAAEVAGEFGYTLPDRISLGIEAAHVEFSAKSITVNGTQTQVLSGGHVSESAVLADAAYEIPYRDNINWIIGAGAGMAQVSPNLFDNAANRLSGNNTNFTWQLLAGANWAFTPVFRLQLDYRFRSVLGTNHNFTGTQVQFGSLSSQALMLTLRWLLVAPV